MKGCKIGDDGFKILAEGLVEKQNTGSMEINLSYNLLTNLSIIFINDDLLKIPSFYSQVRY